MNKFIQDFKIIRNRRLNAEYFILELEAPEKLPEILPGQFVEALVENSKSTFLRRPFSIHNVNYGDNTLSLFIRIAGEGTRAIAFLEEDDYLNLIFPLGNSFSMPGNFDNVLLIGGGCGAAPLLYLARYLTEKDYSPTILLGAKSKDDIHELHEYEKYGEAHVATEDGSMGEDGLVMQHTILQNEFPRIYTCGPEMMMKAVAKYAHQKNISCEVSLENTMACGIGACLCCVTDTVNGNVCVCTHGPVFNTNVLKW